MKRGSIAEDDASERPWARRRRTPQRRKVATAAAMISLLFPGLGHLLIPARTRGAIWLLGWLVLGGLGAGVPALVLHVIAAGDAYVYARLAAPQEAST